MVLNVSKVRPHVAEDIHAMAYTTQDKQKTNKHTHTNLCLVSLLWFH